MIRAAAQSLAFLPHVVSLIETPPALSLAPARARARARARHSSQVSLAQDVMLTGLVVVSLPGSFRAAAQSLAFLPL